LPSYDPGDILVARIPDPDGNSLIDPHPCIFIADSISRPGFIIVVGITGSFSEPIDPLWWKMPWDPNRHPATGLTKPCVAKCNWHPHIPQTAVRNVIGKTPNDVMLEVAYRLRLHLEQQRAHRKRENQSSPNDSGQ